MAKQRHESAIVYQIISNIAGEGNYIDDVHTIDKGTFGCMAL